MLTGHEHTGAENEADWCQFAGKGDQSALKLHEPLAEMFRNSKPDREEENPQNDQRGFAGDITRFIM